MTSEVALLNSIGIALAADSAVTVGGTTEKIYTSVEKLFLLSEHAPVGVMVYGSASFLEVPWETIIKVFRKKLGSKKFDTTIEYGQYLISWLVENYELFPEDSRRNQVIRLISSYYIYLREEIREYLDEIIKEKDCLGELDIPDALDKIIKTHLEFIRLAPVLNGFDKTDNKLIRQDISSLLKVSRKDIFGDLPFKPSTKRLLTTMAVELIVRHYFWPFVSGVVVAGFGEKEFMPSLIAYEVEEMIGDKIRLVKTHEEKITNTGKALIVPFAQKDMVYVFMEGIDSELNSFMMDSTAKLLVSFSETLVDFIKKLDEKLGESLQEVINLDELIIGLFEGWDRKRQGHWMPVVQVVASLPKNELAEMAESLVNLTKLRRKVTTVPETVGGPVDVAMITKGDGFIWIKRKHYFESSLNPRFVARYQDQDEVADD